MEAAKLQAALSASSTLSIWILGKIRSEAWLRNFSQSVWISTRAEMSLALT
jgi:hypothetical protein